MSFEDNITQVTGGDCAAVGIVVNPGGKYLEFLCSFMASYSSPSN